MVLTTSRSRLAIVGAGPAGLTAALAAARLGAHVTVFEAAADFARVGGGIVLHQNGLRVLARLGLLASFEPFMIPCRSIRLLLGPRTEIRNDYHRHGAYDHFAVVPRFRLQEHLLDAARGVAEIVMGHRCTNVDVRAERVHLQFASGATAECDVLIGADGAHSRVRESLSARAVVKATGDAFLRGVSELPTDAPEVCEIWGDDGRRFGFAPLPGGSTYFYCSAPLGGWDEVLHGGLEAWIRGWSAVDERAVRILRHVRDWDAVNYDEPEQVWVERWSGSRIILIGDAAHAMTPDYGQGANAAMVDGLVLMTHLARSSMSHDAIASAAQQYEAIRRPFVDRTQSDSWRTSRMARVRSPAGRWARNTLVRLVSRLPAVRTRQLRRVAGDNPNEAGYL